jgi:hypothetical protein
MKLTISMLSKMKQYNLSSISIGAVVEQLETLPEFIKEFASCFLDSTRRWW